MRPLWTWGTGTALLTLMAGACWLLVGCERFVPPAGAQPMIIGGHEFLLELALDEADQIRGLSGRDHIEPNGGMLFVFNRAQERQFWMRGCRVPIDIIFLDDGARIVAMHEMQPPPARSDDPLRTYPSIWPARFAIELAGGTLRGLNLHNGQKLDLPGTVLKPGVR